MNICMLLATAALGSDFWQTSLLGLCTIRTLLIYTNAAVIGVVMATILVSTLSKAPNVMRALLDLVPIAAMDLSLYCWFKGEFLLDFAWIILPLHGIVFSGVCDKLIISSVSHQEFPWLQTEVFVPYIFLVQDWLGLFPRLPALCALCIFLVIQFIVFVIQVVWQISTYLGISVFKVKNKE